MLLDNSPRLGSKGNFKLIEVCKLKVEEDMRRDISK